MEIQAHIIEKLNLALNIPGRPHFVFGINGPINTNCVEWTTIYKEQETASRVSPELADALNRYNEYQRLMRRRKLKDFPEIVITGNENLERYRQQLESAIERRFFANEPAHIWDEYKAYEFRLMVLQAAWQKPGFSEDVLKEARLILQDEPVFVYRVGPNWNTIVVAPTTDQFDSLRYEQTIGNNLELDTESIIERLMYLETQFGIDITGVDSCGVQFNLKRIPEDKEADDLGIWLTILCPDLLETPSNLHNGKVELWWD